MKHLLLTALLVFGVSFSAWANLIGLAPPATVNLTADETAAIAADGGTNVTSGIDNDDPTFDAAVAAAQPKPVQPACSRFTCVTNGAKCTAKATCTVNGVTKPVTITYWSATTRGCAQFCAMLNGKGVTFGGP
jgi:hypothetical protein